LLDAIGDGRHLAFATAELPVAAQAGALIAAERLVEWLGRTYSQPASDEEDAWAPPYLEYQFACSAPAGPSTTTTLIAKQYHHGDLDWYSFDTGAAATGEAAPGGVVKGEPIAFSPTSIEFGGMPNVRWWELEDQQTDLGDLHASTTDLALLMLTEFGLSYANDWSLVPYDLEVGTLAEVRGVVVTDVFGVRTLIRAAGSGPGADWHRWGMYQLSQSDPDVDADTRLFLPPTLGPIEEGAPLERIILTRDEMANMVWAIEDVVPGFFGSGINGYEAATDLLRHLVGDGDEGVAEEARAELAYRLRTSVAENWIPFIPVRRPDTLREIQLQRAAMPRTADGSNTPVQPRSVVLRHALDLEIPAPYLVHEEEVARAGAIVTRSFQRTRWWDGRTYTWVGRRKQTGRGQGSSGLAFDSLVSAPR